MGLKYLNTEKDSTLPLCISEAFFVIFVCFQSVLCMESVFLCVLMCFVLRLCIFLWLCVLSFPSKPGYDLRNGSEISDYGKGLYSSEMYATRAEEIIRESTHNSSVMYNFYDQGEQARRSILSLCLAHHGARPLPGGGQQLES